MTIQLLIPLSQGRKWGLGTLDGHLILLQSKMRPVGFGRKERRWWAFPYPDAAPRYATKSEICHVLRRRGIRLTKSAKAELNDLPEKFVDWPSWYQELD
jgi:hypothetical protein